MAHSKGNWKVGIPGTVVTDDPEGFPPHNNCGRSDTEYYGGYLIAESILKKEDAQLISAAADLLDACRMLIGSIYEDEDDLTELAIRKGKEAINKALGKES